MKRSDMKLRDGDVVEIKHPDEGRMSGVVVWVDHIGSRGFDMRITQARLSYLHGKFVVEAERSWILTHNGEPVTD
jgi:hypothetical protein